MAGDGGDDALDYVSVQRPSVPMSASSTWHCNGVNYTPAEWDFRCRLDKIEQMLSRIISHLETPR